LHGLPVFCEHRKLIRFGKQNTVSPHRRALLARWVAGFLFSTHSGEISSAEGGFH
jgi:hypothetical protein